jgi:exodeoxyribonuclease V alpha subunit
VYGRQFKAHQSLKSIPPTTLEGMEHYLGSGSVKGIGAHTAKILIQAFGEETFNVLDKDPDRVMGLTGIGIKRKKQILNAWAEQQSVRDIVVFLQSHGISTARAMRIYKSYGDSAILKVSENPYRLTTDIPSIGFKTADDLALRLGRTMNSIERARAGLHYVLQEHCRHGHCAAEYSHLIKESVSLLNIDEAIIIDAIDKEIAVKNLVRDQIDNLSCVFPPSLYRSETEAAQNLLRIRQGTQPWGEINVSKMIPWVETQTGLQLADSQKHAIEIVLKHKLAIITGGPGVGKTTIVNSILKMIQAESLSVALCAPTGRAAKRLSETTGFKAKTIHRLLGFNPETRSFKHHQNNPLPIDALVVDEASMIDIVLLHHLLKAIPDHAALLFVGDVDQLPSVGSGAVLLDMIRSDVIPTVRLTEIFRQATDSKIIVNAHRINQGELPLQNDAAHSDFYTIYTESTEEIYTQLIELVSERLPQYLNCNLISDIQVLTPMNRGSLGSVALNIALQKKLNGEAEPKVTRYGFTFSPGDKVIQTVNNYDKEVFNGDIGFVTNVNLIDSIITVSFDNRIVEYTFNDLDELSLAYAISIHKSQGSEFPAVVMVLSVQHYMLLARNLLYTGVTRGKRLVVLIGEKRAVQIAVKNNRENKRLTTLSQRLKENVVREAASV